MQNLHLTRCKTNVDKNNAGNDIKTSERDVCTNPFQECSMKNHILWNISRALEQNPKLNLSAAIKSAQDRLERNTCNISAAISQNPEEQYLVCALLAWQQLGHTNTDSLHEFLASQEAEQSHSSDINSINDKNSKSLFLSNSKNVYCKNDQISMEDIDTSSFGAYSKGPVVKLPLQSKIVMRCEHSKRRQLESAATSSKIEAACCMESVCTERLAAMDAATTELRNRVAKLAKREAERVVLLERAEAAWGDLERGYQRRLAMAQEREDDISRHIKKAIEDRNANKNACTELAKQLKAAGDAAANEQATLSQVEKDICCRTCVRLKLSEEVARGEAALTDLQCKVIQLDRDLQFKDEQARRKLLAIDSETESARVLTLEAERALRAELGGLRQQMEQVSAELLDEDEANKRIKTELERLREEKAGMVEDLDGCKAMCDTKMQSKLDEIKEKKNTLEQLKSKLIDCKCKVPVDASVTVKRTASLAALCRCDPEDRFLESCSCTSLRGRLISNLLADLFGGLQSELSGTCTQMPCQFLKCLEDKHNWDRSSVVKTNLRNFFSKLLVGELDIAIATSIENYHAKWIGASCADEAKLIPDPKDDLKEGWEQRALEKRAQKLATKLAEQLFEDRAEELTKRAKQIVTKGPPPCECNKLQKRPDDASVLPCLTEMITPFSGQSNNRNQLFTQQDVTEIKLQIEDLKKVSLRKEDLKLMEEKFAQMVKQATTPANEKCFTKNIPNPRIEAGKKPAKNIKHTNVDDSPRCLHLSKGPCAATKVNDINFAKKYYSNEKPTKQSKKYNHNQSYAVNVCLCGPVKANGTLATAPFNTDKTSSLNQNQSKESLPQISTIVHTKSIISSQKPNDMNKKLAAQPCGDKKIKCLHGVPSDISIGKLLDTVKKWKNDLGDLQENIGNVKSVVVSEALLDKSCNRVFKHKKKVDSKKCFLETSAGNQNNNHDFCNKVDLGGHTTQLFNLHRAVNTASVYMAAVNLDKSNNLDSKGVNTIDYKETLNNLKVNTFEYKSPIRFEDINKIESKDMKKIKVLNEHLYGKIRNNENVNILLPNSKSDKSSAVEEIEEREVKKKNNYKTNLISKQQNLTDNIDSIQSKTNRPDLITDKTSLVDLSIKNNDYYIKFLGVTLNNIASPHQQSNQTKNYNRSETTELRTESELVKNQKKDNFNAHNVNPRGNCNLKTQESNTYVLLNFDTLEDKNHDSNGLKYTENTIEQCVCCNANKDSSKDLEENAFHLLEDHLRQKLKEYKICSCGALCMLPEEEEKIFTTILQRVRQVISDYANQLKCIQSEGSWNRACALLSEYLKIKMKRVQGLPFKNKSNDEALPDILKKVCNLIEQDFQRLKDICKCQNYDKIHKNNLDTKHLCNSKELPERDTNMPIKKYSNNNVVMYEEHLVKPVRDIQNMSCQISPNLWMESKSCEAITGTKSAVQFLDKIQTKHKPVLSLILRQTISAQVPSDSEMTTQSCEIMETNLKSDQITTNNVINTPKEAQRKVHHYFNSYRNLNNKEVLKLCRNKELLLNLYADVLINYDFIGKSKQSMKQTFNVGFVSSLPNLSNLNIIKTHATSKNLMTNDSESPSNRPHFGCTCDDNRRNCICTKSLSHSNNYGNIDTNWQPFITYKNNNIEDSSYIVNRDLKKQNLCNKTLENISQYITKENDTKNEIEAEAFVENNAGSVVLLHSSKHTQEAEKILETNKIDKTLLDWGESPQSMQHNIKILTKEHINSPQFGDEFQNLSGNVTTVHTATLYQKCNCNKVPICHVKMLVENIERNLMESKCTCDSIAKVCPVHSRIIT